VGEEVIVQAYLCAHLCVVCGGLLLVVRVLWNAGSFTQSCACACVRSCVRVRACVRMCLCVCACAHACVRVCTRCKQLCGVAKNGPHLSPGMDCLRPWYRRPIEFSPRTWKRQISKLREIINDFSVTEDWYRLKTKF